MQGLYIAFQRPEGPVQRFVASKATIEVPDSWGGKVIDNLIRRRMIKVTQVADPTPTPASEAATPTKKKIRRN